MASLQLHELFAKFKPNISKTLKIFETNCQLQNSLNRLNRIVFISSDCMDSSLNSFASEFTKVSMVTRI